MAQNEPEKQSASPAAASGQKRAEPVIIFMASSTPEKIRDFRLIAEAKKYPIIVEDIHKLVDAFHHVDEVNTDFKDNAADKLKSINVNGFRSGSYARQIEQYCKSRGLPENSRVYFATEDSGFNLKKEIWDKVDKDGIPEEVLNRLKKNKSSRYTGPGVETGPIINAKLGDGELGKEIEQAIRDAGREGQHIPVKSHSVLTLSSLNNAAQEPIIIKAAKSYYFHGPASAKTLSEGQKVSNYHFFKPNKGINQNIGELGEEGIISHSARARLVDMLYDRLFDKSVTAPYHHEFRSKVNGEPYRVGAFGSHDAEILLGNMTDIFKEHGLWEKNFNQHITLSLHSNTQEADSNRQNLIDLGLKSEVPKNHRQRIPNRPYFNNPEISGHTQEQLDYDFLRNIGKVMANSDAAILFPDMRGHDSNPTTKHEIEQDRLKELVKIYTLFSLEVNKQLNARDHEKPVILLNHDGSWNNAIAIHNNLANLGLTKEFSIPPGDGKKLDLGRVNIQSNSYYDVLGTPKNGNNVSYKETVSAAIKLLEHKRKGYSLQQSSGSEVIENGNAPENFGGYKVAIFCSASNENKYLNEAVKNLSYELAKDKFGIIYGGGDRYTMGAVLDGVKKYREELMYPQNGDRPLSEEKAKRAAYVAGFSTRQILKSETSRGKFSEDLSYSKQNRNIYQRMSDMLNHSNAIIAAPGGAGTVQEWAAAMILNYSRPKQERKPIVFYNPELNKGKIQVWNTALKAVLGEKDYNIITSKTPSPEREERCKKLGIYVETTEEGVKKRIEELRKNHKKSKSFVEEYLVSKANSPSGKRLH